MTEKKYHYPMFANQSDEKLNKEIYNNLDDIRWFIRNVDWEKLDRRNREDLYKATQTLYWILFDCIDIK